jgi:3-oxoacyl-[acyl-carrier protein] reductase
VTTLVHEGRVALVTGAAKNIGAAVARRLAADGAAVAVNHRSSDSRAAAEETVERIVAAGGRAARFQADVADEDQVRAMVEEVGRVLGPVGILVNNAARSVASQVPWTELTVEAWDEVLRANVTGAFLCARAVHPPMREAGRGEIANMSSIRAVLGREGNLHYTASKAALIGLTRTLARELGPENIRVNALLIGAIRTPEEATYGPPEEIDRMLFDLQSLKLRGEPDDVAAVTSFLVSSDARFITGQCVTVDGGWWMH